jgi:surfactin family lipopeptide synthetase A
VGLFINAIPIRITAQPGETFLDLVKKVQSQMIQNRSYEYVPLAEIQSNSRLKRDLINHLFIFENYPVDRQIKNSSGDNISLFSVKDVEVFEQTTYDLNVLVTFARELEILITYNALVYNDRVIKRIEDHMGRLAEQVTAGEIPLEEIEVITRAEKNQILYDFNDTRAPYPEETAFELFEKQEAAAPGRTAVVYDNSFLSYGQVNRNVNRLARLMSRYGIEEKQIVGLLLERSPRLFETIMALWKLGAAYIPMETDYPPQRINEILNDSDTCFLITRSEFVNPEIEESFQGSIIKLDKGKNALLKEDGSNLDLKPDINNLAYVLYTSGSTGKPKGAMVEHIGSMNHMQGKIHDTQMDANSIMVQNGPQTFDVSIWQFFAPLTLGSRTIIYTQMLLLEPDRFISRLIRDQVTILEVVPSYLTVLLDYFEKLSLESLPLKYLLPTGEELKPLLVKKWFKLFPGIKMINTYGPTEASDDIAHYVMEKSPETESIPLGKPLQNLNMYVVDKHMKLCPVGIKGEICVSGIGVGRGYLKDEAMTKLVFMEDPFLEEKGVRLYKMGDLGCWLPDGNFLFFGRKDYQVKIRGHLVECGEIENRLLDIHDVKETVVIDREDIRGNKYLCAYLVSDSSLDIPGIKARLSTHLPDYMIPAYFMEIDRMPLTANGKIDRKALPLPQASISGSEEYEAPRDEVEKVLAEIWEELLAVSKPGINDNFFDFGGHSLNGMTLLSSIHKRLNVEIPITELFNRPTIKEISDYIKSSGEDSYFSVAAVEKKDYYPLSSAQSRLVVLDNIAENSTAYNLYTALELAGTLDTRRLEKAFKDLIKRHESLRTVFVLIEGKPVQVICQQVDFQIEYYNKNRIVEGDIKIKSIMHNSFIRPFDLSRAPLIRAGLIKTGGMKYLVMMDIHHIVCDGVAFDTIARDISKLYAGESLPGLRIQYKDYAFWQLETMKSEKSRNKEKYWMEKLSGEIPVLNLFSDYPRPPVQSFAGSNFTSKIEKQLSGKIKALAGKKGATLYMTLLAVYNVLLSIYTGQEDIIVGTPTAGRQHADLKDILGMFVNMLTMRNYPSGEKTFDQFLQEVKENALNVYQNQDYQFEELVAKLDLRRDLSRNPLFDTVFALQNINIREIRLPGLQVNKYNFDERTAKYDIILYASETGEEILLQFNYCTKLFRRETIQQLCQHFINVLEKVVHSPKLKLYEIQVLSKSEEERLLYEFNNTESDYPQDKTIPGLFRQQVEKTPDHIAVIGKGQMTGGVGQSGPTDRIAQITYSELNEQSNRLAHLLREKGVEPDRNPFLAIKIERSLEMIISIMGILKAGGAYLPIDPDYPQERIDFMLKDSGTKIVVTHDLITKAALITPHTQHTPLNQPRHPAYIIYTSGTTGRPKGVIIEHINVLRLFFNDRPLFDFNRNDIWTNFHSYCFDFSVWEMYGALLLGGKLVIIPKIIAQDPRVFLSLLNRNNVTILNQTPSAFYNLINEELTHQSKTLNLRYVIFGGEALSPAKLKVWKKRYPGTKLVNMFGITETTVHVTYKEITDKEIDANKSCIGNPIPTLSTYLFNPGLKLSPMGTPGELCVGGSGVARGYLNRPELSHEKFIENPFQKGERLYKSGDLARRSNNAGMEYLGRLDQQTQIRGFRVEAGEIENQLLKHEDIMDVVVIAKEDKANNKFLIAYIVSDSLLSVPQLRGFLSNQLPDYMIPAYFVQIPRIPLTSNGKIDKIKLPEPDVTSREEYAPPGDKIEAALLDTWKEILELEKIGVNDNFFNIGGDSIKAIRLVNSINKRSKTNIKILDLFTNNTIRELSRVVKSGTVVLPDKEVEEAQQEIREFKRKIMKSGKIPPNVEDVFPMSDIEKGMIFYSYRNPDQAIYHDQFVYNQKYSMFNPDIFRRALELMVEKHSILRTSYNVENFNEFVHFIHKPFPVVYNHFDIQGLDKLDQRQYILKYMEDDRKDRWDITSPPLCRMATFYLGRDNICAVWTFHHAILDGWSNASLMTELNNTYFKLKVDKSYTPGRLKISYKKFIINEMAEKKKTSNLVFWKKELEDYKRISFPGLDKNEPGEIHDFSPPASRVLNEKLLDTSKRYNTSLKHISFAAYVYMMSMLTYEDDVAVGLISNNRPEKEDGDKLIGCFLNTLPFRINIPAKITWSEYIRLVDRKLIRLKRYEKITFYEIVKSIGERNRAENPIFDTIFNYIDFHIYKQAAAENNQADDDAGVTISGYEKTNTIFDFMVTPYLQGISVSLRYSTSIVSDRIAEKLYGYFEHIIKMMISRPEAEIRKDEIIPEEEKKTLLYEFNDTDAGYPKDKTIHGLFQEQVQTAPDRTALIFEDKRLTYKELDEKTGRLARRLQEKGIGPNTITAIMVQRSIEMMIGIMGILKAGGAYLPIDPDYPQRRIDFMLNDSGAKILLAASGDQVKIKVKDESNQLHQISECFSSSTSTFLNLTQPRCLAYVIYTSGTTGKPKGVVIEHHSLVNRLNWMQRKYPIDHNDTILQKTTFTFDVSVWEIFWWSIVGAKVCLLVPGGEKNPGIITETVERNNVTTMHFVPSMLSVFLDYLKTSGDVKKLSGLKQVIASGEALMSNHVQGFNQLLNQENGTILANLYGPTEATIDVSYFDCWQGGENEIIPIGKPIDNIGLYILDKHLHIQPIGIPGELCISGIGLTRGYLNRPGLTAEKFIHLTFDTKHLTLYRTGDLARWQPDGNIEFLARIDHQVKIRGFRVELGEIENCLLAYEGIKEAAIIIKEDEEKNKFLYAYIVSNSKFTIPELKTFLRKQLPDYMIPSHFIKVDQIPLTPNGKVDWKALNSYGTPIETGKKYVAPKNKIETIISGVWQEVLHLDKVGIHDNFFDLGGDSLLIIKAISKIGAIVKRDITVLKMYQYPTIQALADYLALDENEPDHGNEEEKEKLDQMGDVMEESIRLFEERSSYESRT